MPFCFCYVAVATQMLSCKSKRTRSGCFTIKVQIYQKYQKGGLIQIQYSYSLKWWPFQCATVLFLDLKLECLFGLGPRFMLSEDHFKTSNIM